jgi:hypothetical protein
MNQRKRVLSAAISATLCLGALAGCNRTDASRAAPVSAASSAISAYAPTPPAPLGAATDAAAVAAAVTTTPLAAPVSTAYVLPDANQLYELVAPIALFPD